MSAPVSLVSEHPWIVAAVATFAVGTVVQTSLEQSSRLQDLGIRRTAALVTPWNLWAVGLIGLVLADRPVFFLFFILPFAFSIKHPKPGPPAHGLLQQRIEELGAKAGAKISDANHWAWDQTNACIIHDTFRWWSATAANVRYVLVPLRYLAWLNRAEIDALIARQLPRKNGLWSLAVLLYALVAGLSVKALHLSTATTFKLTLIMVAIEVVAILIAWPHIDMRTHLWAIRLMGNAEAYLSAHSELSKLNKARLNNKLLDEIARRTSVSPDRLKEVMTQPRPAEDRYPLEQGYFRTAIALAQDTLVEDVDKSHCAHLSLE